jgi:hypothetical protein
MKNRDRYAFDEVRTNRGYKWEHDAHSSYISGFVVDDLNVRELDAATTPFEKIFIDVRNILTIAGSWCCDNEEDVLNASQTISRHISKHLNFYISDEKD